jgi:hypothetical protein
MTTNQWLMELEEGNPDGYVDLLVKAGSLAAAAHQVATARCQVRSIPSSVPTRLELGVAATFIAQRAGLPSSVPSSRTLALWCEAEGLPVL